ncbi:hypothetical protein ACFLV7_08710 [Chloroflexota bacterium]
MSICDYSRVSYNWKAWHIVDIVSKVNYLPMVYCTALYTVTSLWQDSNRPWGYGGR